MWTMNPSRSLQSGRTTGQWKKACSIDSSNAQHQAPSDETANSAANNFLPTQRVFQITNQVREVPLFFWHFILGVRGHRKQLSSPSYGLADQILWSPHLINKRYNALLAAVCQRDLFSAERELSEHADSHDRRGTSFCANDGCTCQRSSHFLTIEKIV